MDNEPKGQQMKANRTKPTKLRAGTPEHDTGLALLMLTVLIDDCSPQAKRRRSELGERFSRHEVAHADVADGLDRQLAA